MAKTRDANRIIDDVTGDDEELQQMIADETVNAEVDSGIRPPKRVNSTSYSPFMDADKLLL